MKSNQIAPDATLEQIITTDQSIAELLSSIGLNASRHQDKTLRQICTEKKWNEEEVLKWIKKNQYLKKMQTEVTGSESVSTESKSMVEICEDLEGEHHIVIRELMNDIKEDLPRVCKIHGHQYPWVKQVHTEFESFYDDFSLYLKFEEEKFFSFIRQLYQKESQVMDGLAQSLRNAVYVLKKDHKRLLENIQDMEKTSRNFFLPEGSCTTFRIVNQNLSDLFDTIRDLFEIEEEHLFPKVKKKLDSI